MEVALIFSYQMGDPMYINLVHMFQFIIWMNNYLKENEGEKRLLRAQLKRLCQENAWLREQIEQGVPAGLSEQVLQAFDEAAGSQVSLFKIVY